ncbi:MAG: deoxyribonuclease IV [Clostridiaceae bacterium]|nr:deoxyribonuclease IV [Clostridiaceae bacterium]
MFRIGCHLSSSKGYLSMGKEALAIGANTFQFFSRNPRGGSVKPLDLKDIKEYLTFAENNDISHILAHAPYTLNACAADPGLREFARNTMLDDLQRLEYLPGNCYNFHPGSHVKQGVEIGIELIISMLNDILWPEMHTTVLLETMAGKGSEVGRTFEEIRSILDGIVLNEKMGVCLDTCHIWEAGYNIVDDLDGVIAEFDRIIGLDRLKAVHLNDSKNPIEAHKDRHEKIGEGALGLELIERVINHPVFREIPFYLETPNELEGYEHEISLLKALYK